MDRESSILQIRPEIIIDSHEEQSEAERFQNKVLRPILKLQHPLLCFIFSRAQSVTKQSFHKKHEDQKRVIIRNTLKSDLKLKSQIIDSITSLMTIEELEHFHQNKSEYNKRIISMSTQRLMDGLI